MNAEQMQKSIVHETRLMRIMVIADMAANEVRQLVADGYDPEQMGKYEEVLLNMGTSLVQRIQYERERRASPEKPGIIVPFSRAGKSNGQ